MEIVISENQQSPSVSQIIIRHNGEELPWMVQSQMLKGQTAAKGSFDVFEEINKYWAYCKPATQDMIFEIYSRIYGAIQDCWNVDNMIVVLRPLVAELFELHPQADLHYWVWTKSNVMIPRSSIHAVFDPTRMQGTRERTYLEEDYKHLIPLAISMRVMIPVWGEFLHRTRREVKTIFNLFQAFQLLGMSNVMQCEAMKRLDIFVRHTIPKDRSMDAPIFLGISSEDVPIWVLSTIVVRRLSCADVRGLDPDTNLASYLFIFINQKLTNLDSQVGKITPKHGSDEEGGPDSDSNHSRLEGFRIKQDIPEGDIAVTSHYIRMTVDQAFSDEPLHQYSLINRLCPNPKEPDPAFRALVARSLDTIGPLLTEQLNPTQVMLAGWVMNQHISIRAMPHLKKVDVLSLIALARAYLWNMGHLELAGLVSAVAKSNDMGQEHHMASITTRMNKEQLAELERRYPYLKRTTSRAKNAKSLDLTVNAIDDAVEQLSYHDWYLTLPDEWVTKLQGNMRWKRFQIPADIRNMMARLIIELDSRYESTAGHVPSALAY